MERASGFGFRVLDPPELADRFGGNPLPFYAYNIASSVLSVLLSEPRGGVYATSPVAVIEKGMTLSEQQLPRCLAMCSARGM